MMEAKNNFKLFSSLAPIQTLFARSCFRIVWLVSMECPHIALPVVTVWCISREVLRQEEKLTSAH